MTAHIVPHEAPDGEVTDLEKSGFAAGLTAEAMRVTMPSVVRNR
jgi:hypothetical protein